VFVNPRRSGERIRNFFEQEYITTAEQLDYQFGEVRARTLKREARLIKKMVRGGRILDIGCAGGEFLSLFEDGQWERVGVEPSRAAGAAASRRGIEVLPGAFSSVQIQPGSFDVVTYLDAIYFSPSPLQDLLKIRGLLKSGGLFVVEIPGHLYRLVRNIGPVSLLVNRRWCQMSSASPHLYHFSDRAFRQLLSNAGFGVFKIALERSPDSGGSLFHAMNAAWFALSTAIAGVTLGAINPAAKVVYFCRPLMNASEIRQ
jgi:SAM-dependent methyltransferase